MTMDLVTTGQQRPHLAPLARPDHTRDGCERRRLPPQAQSHSTEHRARHAADGEQRMGGWVMDWGLD